jgi:putative transferase (TIGR04331 family)
MSGEQFKMKRYLVTTAEEMSWRSDVPLLFLGEWCRRRDRQDAWSTLDYELARPYWIYGKPRRDLIDFNAGITRRVAADLAGALNAIHDEEYSERYWRIIVLAWVHKLTSVVSNRFNALRQAIDGYEIEGTTCIRGDGRDLATNDLMSFIYSTARDRWNHHIFSAILREMAGVQFPIHEIALADPSGAMPTITSWSKQLPEAGGTTSWQDALKRLGKRTGKYFFSRISPRLCAPTDAYIVSSFLSIKDEIRLQLRLGQVPQFRQQLPIPTFEVSPTLRTGINVERSECGELERIVRRLVPQMIPMCYVEGYKTLKDMVASLPWPARPKFIYTANNFETDELFKLWTAGKVEQAVPYYVGQHGNNYGTMHGSQHFPEKLTCDRLFTWGWRDADEHDPEKIVPAFNFKIVDRKQACYHANGGLLLVQRSPGVHWGPTDRFHEHAIQQQQSLDFFNGLPATVKQATTIRLHKAAPEKDTNDIELWRQCYPAIDLDFGVVPISELFGRSRIVAFTYDSTGMLETLGLNIPTVGFWYGGFENFLESAKPHYALLKDAGIIFDEPADAARVIGDIWNDVDAWWWSDKVQNARRAFCHQYSRWEEKPVAKMKELLLGCAAKDSMRNRREN